MESNAPSLVTRTYFSYAVDSNSDILDAFT